MMIFAWKKNNNCGLNQFRDRWAITWLLKKQSASFYTLQKIMNEVFYAQIARKDVYLLMIPFAGNLSENDKALLANGFNQESKSGAYQSGRAIYVWV
jgi:hypothetical protein